MPTRLDNAMKSQNMILVFGGAVVAATAWVIWGGGLFPRDHSCASDPETWTEEEMRRWLAARNLFPHEGDSREELLARVQATWTWRP